MPIKVKNTNNNQQNWTNENKKPETNIKSIWTTSKLYEEIREDQNQLNLRSVKISRRLEKGLIF